MYKVNSKSLQVNSNSVPGWFLLVILSLEEVELLLDPVDRLADRQLERRALGSLGGNGNKGQWGRSETFRNRITLTKLNFVMLLKNKNTLIFEDKTLTFYNFSSLKTYFGFTFEKVRIRIRQNLCFVSDKVIQIHHQH